MKRNTIGPEMDRLIRLLARIPGLGPRSAKRAVLALLKKKEKLLLPLKDALEEAIQRVNICMICGNLDSVNPCMICQDDRRDRSLIIVVEDVADLWALERSAVMNARYHVLGGHLSPLDGIGPDDLRIEQLIKRVTSEGIREIVMALNATVEGQTTAHYITDMLVDHDIILTKLAHGVPVGGELDYLDDGTIAAALRARTRY